MLFVCKHPRRFLYSFRPFRPSSFYSSSMTWQSLWTQYCNNNINNNNKISASRVCLLRASVMMHYPKCIVRAQINNSQWREYNIRKVAINNWNEIISSRYAVPPKTITNTEIRKRFENCYILIIVLIYCCEIKMSTIVDDECDIFISLIIVFSILYRYYLYLTFWNRPYVRSFMFISLYISINYYYCYYIFYLKYF